MPAMPEFHQFGRNSLPAQGGVEQFFIGMQNRVIIMGIKDERWRGKRIDIEFTGKILFCAQGGMLPQQIIV